jgi:hypothetical protein
MIGIFNRCTSFVVFIGLSVGVFDHKGVLEEDQAILILRLPFSQIGGHQSVFLGRLISAEATLACESFR